MDLDVPNYPSLKGKVCLVTGGTGGVGRAMAMGLAKLGATVSIIGRNVARGEETLYQMASLYASCGRFYPADLSCLSSIRKVGEQFCSDFEELHILVNNAGGMWDRRQLTTDGIERTFAVNHLAYFLLTELLMPPLEKAARARIINVSSEAHRFGTLSLENLQGEREFSGYYAYCQSKRANLLFTYELARRLSNRAITVNAFHPGLVGSDLGRMGPLWIRLFYRAFHAALPTPEEGAETGILLAASSELEGTTGKYFIRGRPRRSAAQTYDVALARKLWAISEQLTS
jgi:NAD(P)-dependent dehydrogenase (short-subunit alcohol dehydrogenase family)